MTITRANYVIFMLAGTLAGISIGYAVRRIMLGDISLLTVGLLMFGSCFGSTLILSACILFLARLRR